MNLQYISGFFDADGSVTLCRKHKNENRSPQVSFHNTQLNILLEIQSFLKENYQLEGYISKKPAQKDTHLISYDLKYTGKSASNLSKILISIHPKKVHRLNTINKYYDNVTCKNGKYNESQLSKKLAFERLFFIL
jgi:erythromycin esterase-like protein